MKQKVIMMLALLCTFAQDVWAQWALVDNEVQLIQALADGQRNIKLDSDIQLSNYLDIDGKTSTIDLNGHKLYRSLSEHKSDGHVIWIHDNSNLTIADNSDTHGGSIEGGKATNGGGINVWPGCSLTVTGGTFKNNSASDNGGAIFVRNGANVTISNASFIEDSAAGHAGAIWNNGTLTATDCTFENNTASDVGAIYNSVTADGVGKATLTDCTFTGNSGTIGAGALANALGATVMTIENCTIKDNITSGHGGAIWNGGTLTATNSTFTNNIANDVGGIYNAVSTDGTIAGKATLKGCTFTGNTGTAGAGALANALGATVMNIENCNITGNTADTYGAGIWNGGTLNMKGAVTVTDNMNVGGLVSNVYLKNYKVITVTGDLTGSSIGVDMEASDTFTSGYSTYNSGVAPNTIFTADYSIIMNLELGNDGEVFLTSNGNGYYIERSWDETNKKVISTHKALEDFMDYDATPKEGAYKIVTNDNGSWFQMGGYSDNVAEYYVVYGNVTLETVVVLGKNVHLILSDKAILTLTGGLKLEDDHKLYIHSQSYGGNMGRLIVTNSYKNAAGIGSAQDNDVAKTVGELVIHGGHIEATGGEYGAGIGSCARVSGGEGDLCNRVTVYGGYVEATGGESGAGIGGGSGYKDSGVKGGEFLLYDGTVVVQGGRLAAGLGGGGSYYPVLKDEIGIGGIGGSVTVYGGSLTAQGGARGAGIGGGLRGSGGTSTIFGGTVTANGGVWATGIGGGEVGKGDLVKIYDGTVTATGGIGASGIGGGTRSDNGKVFIYGGRVLAVAGELGAGIGGGGAPNQKKGIEDYIIEKDYPGGSGGEITITGGTVTAIGGASAASIGGGKNGKGGNVTITGGTVIARGGNQGAFGAGAGSNDNGSLTLDDAMMVGAGDNGSVESIFDADERKNGCWFHSYAEVSPCTHPSGVTYTINEDGTHTTHCKHCGVSETVAHFNSDSTDPCICGYKNGESYCTITLATSSNGTSYEGVGITANVGNNKPYTLPVCSSIPEGYDFAGWVVNPQSQDNGIRPNEGETLLAANSEYVVTASVSIFARYKNLDISLADDSDNAETLYNYNERKAASVTLTGRTLYKDGNWNTLCLPFSLTEDQLAAQLAPGELKTLASSEFADGTLTLTFEDATSIEAGKPYIIKWTSGSHIDEPTFTDVTISDAYNPVETDVVVFVGTYSPVSISEEGDNSMLYLGAGNTLYYPSGTMTIGSFRAYFQLLGGLTAGEPESGMQGIRAFELNFGEEETGIEEVHGYGLEDHGYGPGWHTLDGRRLEDKPTQKGVYISGGRKMIIK